MGNHVGGAEDRQEADVGGFATHGEAGEMLFRSQAGGVDDMPSTLQKDFTHRIEIRRVYANDITATMRARTTLNLPLPQGKKLAAFRDAQSTALEAIANFAPGLLIISFGADTF